MLFLQIDLTTLVRELFLFMALVTNIFLIRPLSSEGW